VEWSVLLAHIRVIPDEILALDTGCLSQGFCYFPESLKEKSVFFSHPYQLIIHSLHDIKSEKCEEFLITQRTTE
jgi:hypothetical protein